MKFKTVIGIDVSKLTLDLCIMVSHSKIMSLKIDNSQKSLLAFWRQLKFQVPEFNTNDSVFCMEHTGIYNHHLLSFLQAKGANICLENPLQIKLSGGMQRGKNDTVDAERIAVYACNQSAYLKLWQPPRDIIVKLKHLSVLRSRLITAKTSLKVPIVEANGFDKKIGELMNSCCALTLKQLEKDLKKIENKINEIIQQDEVLKNLFKITTSVGGVGAVTAVELLISTNEFRSINDAKKFACYSGIVPFEFSSGTSVRGRSRVSHRANKRMKKLLHMGALSALSSDADIRHYYERKVNEGKNKMLVINAIRNKIVQRIFACVRDNRLYEKNYNLNLVLP